MEYPEVRIRLDEGALPPHYASKQAAGADIHAYLNEPVSIEPGSRAIIPTGVYMELPDGYEAQIRPRSGLAFHHGITVLNAPGTIDADYRGEVRVILVHHGDKPVTIHPGERIAQMVIQRTARSVFITADTISDTERGAGGFGSTGR